MSTTPRPPIESLPFDVEKTTPVVCRNCKNPVFTTGTFLRKVSKIVSPNGEEGYLPIPTMICSNCGTMPPEMVPLFIIKELTGVKDKPDNGNPENTSSGIVSGDTPREPITKGGLTLERP